MRFLFYTHSLVSDWNHGNAHFLRGILRELVARGHSALALEPGDGWSRANLVADKGPDAVARFGRDFPALRSLTYERGFDHEARLSEADIVIVHEWTDPALVARIGRARRRSRNFSLLFHDTHHRAVSQEKAISAMPLEDFDAVLVFGEALRQLYLDAGWGTDVHTWHEAADTRVFHPHPEIDRARDLVWIGNWGDGERSAEIVEYFASPVEELGLSGTIHGVRYPVEALRLLRQSGVDYRGWIANAEVPKVFAAHRATVHIPRRPYVESLPGIPTIRMFEALACGIPLVSAYWDDCEGLFRPGDDFLVARSGAQMKKGLRAVLSDQSLAASLVRSGLDRIRSRHTCAHRVDQLFDILGSSEAAKPAKHLAPKEAAQ
jgi:spore maturation protein CgeB